MNVIQPLPCGRIKIPRLPNPKRYGQPLSIMEKAVMRLMCDDNSNKEIATALNLSVKTVEKHRQAVYVKWDVDSAVGVLRHAILNDHYELGLWEGNPT